MLSFTVSLIQTCFYLELCVVFYDEMLIQLLFCIVIFACRGQLKELRNSLLILRIFGFS